MKIWLHIGHGQILSITDHGPLGLSIADLVWDPMRCPALLNKVRSCSLCLVLFDNPTG